MDLSDVSVTRVGIYTQTMDATDSVSRDGVCIQTMDFSDVSVTHVDVYIQTMDLCKVSVTRDGL